MNPVLQGKIATVQNIRIKMKSETYLIIRNQSVSGRGKYFTPVAGICICYTEEAAKQIVKALNLAAKETVKQVDRDAGCTPHTFHYMHTSLLLKTKGFEAVAREWYAIAHNAATDLLN